MVFCNHFWLHSSNHPLVQKIKRKFQPFDLKIKAPFDSAVFQEFQSVNLKHLISEFMTVTEYRMPG